MVPVTFFHWIQLVTLAILFFAGTSWCLAAAPEKLDWSAWQRIPVLHGGRLKPLDTFARQTYRGFSCTGRTNSAEFRNTRIRLI